MFDTGNIKDNLKGKILPMIIGFFILASFFGKYFWILIIAAVVYFVVKNNINNPKKNNMSDTYEAVKIDPMYSRFMKGTKKSAMILVGIILFIWLLFTAIVVIGAGQVGVYSLFGKVRDQEMPSGIHLKNPFAKVTPMSIRTEEYTMSKVATEGRVTGDDAIPALTREGLSLSLDITVLFHLESSKAAALYKEVGLNFEEKVIRPEIRSIIREVIAVYDARDIYSEKRDEVVQKIQDKLAKKLTDRGLTVEDVLLRDVTLPANLATAISEKLQADQEQQKYDFILQKEKKEADRKRIEAAGQRDSQKIINESLSTNYLYYQYINTLKDRAGTIYVPTNPSTGMPQFKELGQ
jgi:regulator of protease activity HflC (stomatin/prohibitin superfamily)